MFFEHVDLKKVSVGIQTFTEPKKAKIIVKNRLKQPSRKESEKEFKEVLKKKEIIKLRKTKKSAQEIEKLKI